MKCSPFAVAVGSCFIVAGARAGSVTVTNAMKKIRAGDPAVAVGQTSINIEAARNEFEAFQIVVRGPATGVTAQATNLTGPGGTRLSAARCGAAGNLRLYRERFLRIGTQLGTDTTGQGCPTPLPYPPPLSDLNGIGGDVPDALVPQVDEFDNQCRNFVFDVPDSQNGIIWVEVFVPKGIPAGDYIGQVDVSWQDSALTCGQTQQSISVRLTVFDFDLNGTSSLRSFFAASTSGALTKQHNVSGQALANLVVRYATLALDHRISMTNFDDGFSFVAPSFPTAYVSNYGPVNNGTAPGLRLQGARTTGIIYMGDKRSSDVYASWISTMNAQNWFNAFLTKTVDEPPFNGSWCDIGPMGLAAHSATGGALLPAMVTSDFESLSSNAVPNANLGCATRTSFTIDPPTPGAMPPASTADINIMAPVIDRLTSPATGSKRLLYSTTPAAGRTEPDPGGWLAWPSGPTTASAAINQLWTYESCDSHGCGACYFQNEPAGSTDYLHPLAWPSIGAVDHSLLRARAMPWIAYKEQVNGIHYFDTLSSFTSSPRVSGDPWLNQYAFGGNGDGTLFYPGTPSTVPAGSSVAIGPALNGTHIPIASLRLKMIREGLEDYEYFTLLGPDERKWVTDTLMPTVYASAWQTDGNDTNIGNLYNARHQMACQILVNLGKPNPCAAQPCTPPPQPGFDTLCGTTCVNIMTDRNNCGGCNTQCGIGSKCNDGVCTPSCSGLSCCGGDICVVTGTKCPICP